MTRNRARVTAVTALAGALALGGCGVSSNTAGGTPAALGGSAATTADDATPVTAAATGPTSGWGPAIWGGSGSGMMGGGNRGSWGPGMMGSGMMGNWWLTGDGTAVKSLAQARRRATEFADRLGLHVGEIMQFTQNFYAELQTADGHPATEALVNPADGAVQIEYGPAMMWNTAYGMRYGSQGQTAISAAQAQSLAQSWLNTYDSSTTVGDTQSYPGYYTLHILRNGQITGMLSVNASTGAVWNHTWHGAYTATSQQ